MIRFHPDKNPGDDAAANSFKEAARASSKCFPMSHCGAGTTVSDMPVFRMLVVGAGCMNSMIFPISLKRLVISSVVECLVAAVGRGKDRKKAETFFVKFHFRCLKRPEVKVKLFIFVGMKSATTCGGNGAKPGTTPKPCEYCGGQGQGPTKLWYFSSSDDLPCLPRGWNDCP